MKPLAAIAIAMLSLSGCASILDNAWVSAAEEECERETSISKRQACMDGVERTEREQQR